ncbi:hypothetical protein ACJH6J_17000 [Mycobacterium sp. SMC-18]|uniref:hypothetical protein n=1 Tax=Mycobacteriaceae TaxID=1762 RepID=UPI000F992D54|nr:hypothetical protein [Mycolicibacterium sp.]RUP26563.1 MAG: hypothetical protein EKK51_29780 [Mycolicibacterium sp.]
MKAAVAGSAMAALAAIVMFQAPTASAASAASADGVINDLRAAGYLVQLNQTPTAPLTACTVGGVRTLEGGTPSALVDIVCPDGC